MANKTVSNLKEVTTVSNSDVLLVETATETLKTTKGNLLKEVNEELNAKSDANHTHDEYVTESELNSKGLATEMFVTNKIAEAQLGNDGGNMDLSGYATTEYVDQEVGKTNAQLSELATKGTTIEVLERVTKEEIERQIADGTVANLTIADNSITGVKIRENSINSRHINGTFEREELVDINNIKFVIGKHLGGDGVLTEYASNRAYALIDVDDLFDSFAFSYEGRNGTSNIVSSSGKVLFLDGNEFGSSKILKAYALSQISIEPSIFHLSEDNNRVTVNKTSIPQNTKYIGIMFDKEADYFVKNIVINKQKELSWLALNDDNFKYIEDAIPIDALSLEVKNKLSFYNEKLDLDIINYTTNIFADKFFNFFDRYENKYKTIFLSAPDIHLNWDSLKIFAYLFNKYPFISNKTFAISIQGDILGGSTMSREKAISELNAYAEVVKKYGLKILVSLGGHDYGNGNGDLNYMINERNHKNWCLTKTEQRQLIINPSLINFDTNQVFISEDENICYYYVKDSHNKTIYIMTDETDVPQTMRDENYYLYDRYHCSGYSGTQLEWLRDVLINVEDGYNIVVFNHTGIAHGTTNTTLNGSILKNNFEGTITSMFEMLKAYKNRTTLSINATDVQIKKEIICDFSNANGKLVGLFSGHTHQATSDTSKGFNIIVSPNPGTYPSEVGLANENSPVQVCGDFIMINNDNNADTLSILRFGRRGLTSKGTAPNVTGDRFVDNPLTF